MEIDLLSIKSEISKLKKVEESYLNIYYYYYNEVKSIDKEWNNIYEKKLMSNVDKEKKEMSLSCDDIKEIRLLYSYIYEKYSNIGVKIKVNIDEKENINNQISFCINFLKKIINNCNNKDTSNMDEGQISTLYNIIKKMRAELNLIEEIKDDISFLFDSIEEIENNVRKKLSRFKVSFAQETDISGCIEQ